MKLDIVPVLGALLLVACSGSESTPVAGQPTAVTAPATPAPATSNAKTEAAPATGDTTKTETETTTETAPTAPVALTCATAKTVEPAGKLALTSVGGFFEINPVDVYATETASALIITLTETASECGYRSAKLAHAEVNELRIKVAKKTDAPIATGELAASEIQFQSGTVCIAEDEFGSGGNSSGGGSARGKVTITAKTATSIEGTFDVRDFQGKKTVFAFTAPICGAAPSLKDAVCCGGTSKDDE